MTWEAALRRSSMPDCKPCVQYMRQPADAKENLQKTSFVVEARATFLSSHRLGCPVSMQSSPGLRQNLLDGQHSSQAHR